MGREQRILNGESIYIAVESKKDYWVVVEKGLAEEVEGRGEKVVELLNLYPHGFVEDLVGPGTFVWRRETANAVAVISGENEYNNLPIVGDNVRVGVYPKAADGSTEDDPAILFVIHHVERAAVIARLAEAACQA